MHELENAALVSIGRAYGFSWLAILCIIFAFSFQPPLAAAVGGVLCIIFTLVLGACAWYAKFKKYDRTQMWMMLPKEARPPKEVAQRVISRILRDTYLWFAKQTAVMSIVFLAIGILLKAAGLHELPGATRASNVERPLPAILVDDSETMYGLRIEVQP